MGKRQQEELRRLEEALLESEYENDVPGFSAHANAVDPDMYNTDDADVDMDAYSEEVHRGPNHGGLSVVLTMLTMVLLSAAILLFLKFLGVL